MAAAPKTGLPCPYNYQHAEINHQRFYVFFDDQRRWLYCSPALADFFGYAVEELVGGTADKLLPPGFTYNDLGWEQFLEQGRIRRFIPLTKRSGEMVGTWINYQTLADGCMLATLEFSTLENVRTRR